MDLDLLFSKLQGHYSDDFPMPANTRIGHVHIYSRDIDPMMHFYRDILGFGQGFDYKEMRMADVGLDEEQNHVIAFNNWRGSGANLFQAGALGLKYYTIELKNQDDYQGLLDRLDKHKINFTKHEDGILLRDPANLEIYVRVDN